MKKFQEWVEICLVSSIFSYLFILIQIIFRAKSQGLLNTEKEWYLFGSFALELLPICISLILLIGIVTYIICITTEKIYHYFKDE